MRVPHLRLALIAFVALGASDSRMDRADAGDPPKPAGRAARCVVEGRVVDGWESGVVGAKVAWVGDLPSGDLSRGEPVLSDDAGRFRVELDGPANADLRGTIHATREGAAAALAPIVVGVGERGKDAGSLALTPAQPLRVDVRREGAPVPDAQVWLWAGGYFTGRRSIVFVGRATADANGRAEFAALPRATMRLYVRAPDGSVGETGETVEPGGAPGRVSVELAGSRSLDILVTTDDSPARPIRGAMVFRRFHIGFGCIVESVAAQVPNLIAATAADGRARLEGLPLDARIELVARVPDRPSGRVECKPGETTATIVIPKSTRIPVEEGERPRPPNGTRIVVYGWSTRGAGVAGLMEGGAILAPLVDREIGSGLAVAPDGSLAPLDSDEPTSFFSPRSLVVRVVEKDGRGVAGAPVSLEASHGGQGPFETPRETDAEGRARFNGLAPSKHVVRAFGRTDGRGGSRVAEVDLGPGDATRDVVVGAEGALLAHVTIDGRPGIPEWFQWTIPDAIVVESSVDRAAGTVRIRARAGDPDVVAGSIEFGGKGVRTRTTSFAWPARGGTTAIEVPLFASPEVVVEVRADADSVVHVDVERWDVSLWNVKPWERGQWQRQTGPYQAGRVRTDLPEGRYRLRDRDTGVISQAFEVPERGGSIAATLDLTGLVTIRGHVECPDLADAHGVELAVRGEGIDSHFPMIPSGITHGMSFHGPSFVLRAPAGRSVTISPWHVRYQPAREGGAVTLVGPRDDVVLKLGAGATLVARLTDPDGRPLSADELEHVWIAAIPGGDPSWEPEIGTVTPVAGTAGTVSASGLPFGTLDIWIQTDAFAARRLERTAVASDRTDLGEVRLSRGSKVLLRRVRRDGAEAPADRPIDGWAFATSGPRQIRDLRHIHDEFTGLGAGRWRVEIWPSNTEPGQDRDEHAIEIDVDGEQDTTLDVDSGGWLVRTPK